MNSEEVAGTNLVTNIGYLIESRYHKDRGFASSLDADTDSSVGKVYRSKWVNDNCTWYIRSTVGGYYRLENKKHLGEGFLDADSNEGQGRVYRSKYLSDNTCWYFWSIGSSGSYKLENKWHKDKNVASSLDADSQSTKVYRSIHNSDNCNWYFTPLNYQLYAEIEDFKYLEDSKTALETHQRVDLIDEHDLLVDEHTLGCSINKTFSKTVTDSFSWGLNETLGTSVTATYKCGLPLVGEAEASVTGTVEVGANQQWTSSTEKCVTASATMVAKDAGHFRMSGWVKMMDNVKLPFKAQAVLTATSEGSAVSGAAVKSLYTHEGSNAKFLSVDKDSVRVEITGTFTGSYGLKTFTKTEKCNAILR